MSSNRFIPHSEDDIQCFVDKEANANTKKKTASDIALVELFLANEGETSAIEEIPPADLDRYLSKFLLSVRKKSGEEYEPTTLRGFISSVDRYLIKFRYSESIITGQSFTNTRDVLKSKQKQLKRLGKGNKPQEASPLTDDEITALFTSRVMGTHSPQALINILWFNNCLHFGLRGSKEQRDLKWGDIELKTDLNGKEYLEYSTERQTKTRPGDNPANRRAVKPRMFENKAVGPERDPVFAYKLYRSKRPEQTSSPNSPFYLAVNHCHSQEISHEYCKPWFKVQPMGVNKLNSLMKDCAVKAGIGANKRITNHSARKTLVQKLQDHNVPPTHIAQVTGHKNLQSINNYSCLREEQQEAISSLLSTDTSSPLQTDDSYSARALTLPFKSAKQHNETESLSMFKGNYITGGTFNIHVASSTASNSQTLITDSPKRKYRRLCPLDSSDSSQDN